MKKEIASFLAGAALAGGASFVAHPLPAKIEPTDKILTQDFRGIPAGTVLELDADKYVPRTVPGYSNKADYPDTFWIYDKETLTGKTK